MKRPPLSKPIPTCLILLGSLFALTGCQKQAPQVVQETSQPDLPFTVPALNKHDYVGWSVCGECHKERVHDFQKTRHFLALRTPDQMKFPRGFDSKASPFVPLVSPVQFEATTPPQPAIIATPVNGTVGEKKVSPIAYAYGAEAGTDEVYFTKHGDQIFELPLVWLHPDDCWGTTQFDPYGTGDLSRPLAPQCLECHTVWVDHQRGTHNRYGPLDPQLLGVTCERCHGPAKSHVEYHRTHPGEKVGQQIVQPKTLSRDRLMDVCAQCHTNTVRHRRPPFSFKPGEDLDDSFLILKMKYPEENRVANQVHSFQDSPCFKKSESLSCITCHDPHHVPRRDDPVGSSESCLACHQPESCHARTRLPEAVQDHCAACHMPKRTKVQIVFESQKGGLSFPAPRYEHRIGIYPDAEQEILYDWFRKQSGDQASAEVARLAASLAGHWTQLAEEAKQDKRFLVAVDCYTQVLKYQDDASVRDKLADALHWYREIKMVWFKGEFLKRERRLDEAIAEFEKLLTIDPALAKAHLELGTLYAATARNAEAIEHLKIAAVNDPNDPGAHAMMGWLEFLAGRPETALEHYDVAAEIEPWGASIERIRGQCLSQLGRYPEAALAYLRSLTIDPNQTDCSRELRRTLRERFTAEESLPHAIEAVKITQARQLELLIGLAEIYRDLHQTVEARQVLAVAQHEAKGKQSSLLPQIRTLEKELFPDQATAK